MGSDFLREHARGVGSWNKVAVKVFVLPGGVILSAFVLLHATGLLPLSAPTVQFYYYGVLLAGTLIAWRFRATRIVFSLLTLFLAHRALEFFLAARTASTGPGQIAFEAISFLVPLNYAVFSAARERGWSMAAVLPRVALLFLESVFVAAICRPDQVSVPSFLHPEFLGRHWLHLRVQPLGVLAFGITMALLAGRLFLYRKPAESGLLWSLTAFFLSLEYRHLPVVASAYVATGCLILASSVVENSYVLAYHDELTSLPSRRAFNEAILRLEKPYAIAAVDIDHFKCFNDTYGHDIGDQVLRMVASKLERVSGGGQAYRVGGEEFTILFPGKTMKDTVDHLELLRMVIQDARFRVRAGKERRSRTHSNDRRKTMKSRPGTRTPALVEPADQELSVTVSIGVAEATGQLREVEQVIRVADKALYRAKQAGRNQVALGSAMRTRKVAGQSA